MKAVKIIAGILIAGIALLAYIALRENKRAEYWRTQPMRAARHAKPAPEREEEEEEEEEESEEQLKEEIETMLGRIKEEFPKASEVERMDAIAWLNKNGLKVQGINDTTL